MAGFSYFGHQGEVRDPRDFFAMNDYVVCRGAMDAATIDRLLGRYERDILPSRQRFLRQSGVWERHRLSASGGVENCLLNPHAYRGGPLSGFASDVLAPAASPGLHAALAEVTGVDSRFRLFQTMLFDHSVTAPHQDWIYLDSRPNGRLVAAWLALEDIRAEGIRFFVYPGTQHFRPGADYRRGEGRSLDEIHADFTDEIARHLREAAPEMYAPALRKGDVFFWGSRIIHGSTRGTDDSLRRRSLAMHFVPEGLSFGNLEQDIEVPFAEADGLVFADYPLAARHAEANHPIRGSDVYKTLRRWAGSLRG